MYIILFYMHVGPDLGHNFFVFTLINSGIPYPHSLYLYATVVCIFLSIYRL